MSKPTTTRRNITQPDDYWQAFEAQAKADGLTLAAWLGEAAKKQLPIAVAKKLGERPAAHRPKKAADSQLAKLRKLWSKLPAAQQSNIVRDYCGEEGADNERCRLKQVVAAWGGLHRNGQRELVERVERMSDHGDV